MGYLLKEDGTYLLQEDGISRIILQPTITVKNLSGSLSFNGAIKRNRIFKLFASLSFIGKTTKNTTHKFPAGSLSFSGKTTKKTSKKLSGHLSFSGSVAATKGTTPIAALGLTVLSIPAILDNVLNVNATIVTTQTNIAKIINTITIPANFNIGTGE